MIRQLDSAGSTVFVMIETAEGLENVEEIAAVEGVDVLLLGANDLSLEMGILGEWEHTAFKTALERMAAAAHKAGKILGISGLYTRPDITRHAVRDLGARYILGHIDIGLLSMAMNTNMELLRDMTGST